MHSLQKLTSAIGVVIGLMTPVQAATTTTQLPEPIFGEVHKTEAWTPATIDRVLPAQTKLASTASWYGPGFHGRRTANGEIFNQNALTAAHKSLPFGTRVKVTNLNNGLSTIVRINDHGPVIPGRVIDLSKAAAARIGMLSSGVAPVRLEVLR
jgi:rare lipoprotein A